MYQNYQMALIAVSPVNLKTIFPYENVKALIISVHEQLKKKSFLQIVLCEKLKKLNYLVRRVFFQMEY